MTQPRISRPVYLDQPSVLFEQPPAPRRPVIGPPPPPPPPLPDSRSPQTFVMAEATAIRVLVKLYGWQHLEAGLLRRPGT
jgi:hypothetical protein